jgi:hypothetical protein
MFVKILASTFLFVALSGCANLQAVRDYATESAQFTGFKTLTDHFLHRYEREQPFLSDDSIRLCSATKARALHERRQAAYPDLIQLNGSITAYMMTLAELAGAGSFDLSQSVEGLGSEIRQHPQFGLHAEQVDAYTKLFQLLANAVTYGLQQRAIAKTVESADPLIQQLLSGMENILDAYAISARNERDCVAGNLEIEAIRSKSVLSSMLGKHLAAEKQVEYDRLDEQIRTAQAGVAGIKQGHAMLKENVSTLTFSELADELKGFTRAVKETGKALSELR